MTNYTVYIPRTVWHDMHVSAVSEKEAIDIAKDSLDDWYFGDFDYDNIKIETET